MGEVGHRLDAHIFGVLVAELAFDPQPERRAMRHGQGRAVHLVGQDGLRMVGVDQVDALVVAAIGPGGLVQGVVAVEHKVARLGLQAGARQQRLKFRSRPLADGRPAFDAVVPGDLGAGRKLAQIGEAERQRMVHQAVDDQLPVRKAAGDEGAVIGVRRIYGAVGAEVA
jgi:hypothetical protein